MSLRGYQQALADAIASPDAARRLRAGDDSTLAAYDLTARERARLLATVAQDGMSVNCVLYRAHRMTPLSTLLPRTVRALGPALRAEVDAFWAGTPDTMIQFETEARAFAAFVAARVPEVADVVAEEVAALDARHPRADPRAAF